MPKLDVLMNSMDDFTEEEQKRATKLISEQYGLTYQEARKLVLSFAEKTTKDGKIDTIEANKYNRVNNLIAGVLALMVLNKNAVNKITNSLAKNTYRDNYNYTNYLLNGFKPYTAPKLDAEIVNNRIVDPLDQQAKVNNFTRTQGRLKQTIIAGIQQGKTPFQLNKDIKSVMTASGGKDVDIMINETDRIENQARNDSMGIAESKGLDMFKVWDARLDRKTRTSHADLDGDTVPYNEPFDNGGMYPKDPALPPEEKINCRCRLEPLTSEGNDLPEQFASFKKWKEDVK